MNKILTFTLMFLLTISSVSGGIYLASTAPFIEKFETQLGQLALVNDNDMVEDKVDLDIVGEVAGVTDTSDQYAMLISVAYAQTKPICTTLSANPVSGKAPLNVRLTGSGQDELLSYKFAFGDGEEVTTLENQVTHSYLNPGTYTAVLRVVSNKVESDAVDTCKTTITVSKEVAEVLPQATVESSHLACLNLACVLVSGDGPNECSNNADCSATGGVSIGQETTTDSKPLVPVTGNSQLALYMIVAMGLISSGLIILIFL